MYKRQPWRTVCGKRNPGLQEYNPVSGHQVEVVPELSYGTNIDDSIYRLVLLHREDGIQNGQEQ